MPAKKKVVPAVEKVETVVPPVPVEPVMPVVSPVPPVEPVYAPSAKPDKVQAIAVMTLVNGIVNILWGLGAAFGLTVGLVTICLVPIGILPLILGIFEIIYAAKLLSYPPQPVQPSQSIAILEICCILFANVISLVVGILALVFYSENDVKAYFSRLNSQG